MQKKLLTILSFVLLAGSYNVSLAKDEFNTLKFVGGIVGLAAIAGTGKYVSNMNAEYAKTGKRPDLTMRSAKLAGAVALLVGADIIMHDKQNTSVHLAKIAALGIASIAITDTAANAVRYLPGVEGLLTDPIDENGREEKDLGAAARVLLLYVPLSKLAVDIVSKS